MSKSSNLRALKAFTIRAQNNEQWRNRIVQLLQRNGIDPTGVICTNAELAAFVGISPDRIGPALKWQEIELAAIAMIARRAPQLSGALRDESIGHHSHEECRHSKDFSSVVWFGHKFQFAAQQALVVKVLWEAWKNGTPVLREKTIGAEISSSSDQFRLSNVFRGHPAWKTMIFPAEAKGTFKLQKPK